MIEAESNRPRKPVFGTSSVFAFAILVTTISLGSSCSSCATAKSVQQARLDAVAKAKASGQTNSNPANPNPANPNPVNPGPAFVCQAIDSPTQFLTPPAVGEHRVILSWNASVPASKAQNDAILGYCVHRREKDELSSGLMNRNPVSGTSCSDNRVSNGKTYIYMLTAVTVKGQASKPSTTLTVKIPNKPASAAASLPSPVPSCWGSDNLANP